MLQNTLNEYAISPAISPLPPIHKSNVPSPKPKTPPPKSPSNSRYSILPSISDISSSNSSLDEINTNIRLLCTPTEMPQNQDEDIQSISESKNILFSGDTSENKRKTSVNDPPELRQGLSSDMKLNDNVPKNLAKNYVRNSGIVNGNMKNVINRTMDSATDSSVNGKENRKKNFQIIITESKKTAGEKLQIKIVEVL